MDEDSLNLIAETIPALSRYFLGVFPKNQIISIKRRYPVCFIINTDKFLQPGSHWLAVFISKKEDIFLFDSFGIDPRSDPYLMNMLHSYGKKNLYFSNVQLQATTSLSCGLYSIYILYLMSLERFSFTQCISFFNLCNPSKNELLIKSLFKNILFRLKINYPE